jgi:hypothetical protein
MLATLFGLGIGLGLVLALVVLAILAFEIWILIDVIQNKVISNESRILWIIGMLLLHPIVAIVYYFTDHQKTR